MEINLKPGKYIVAVSGGVDSMVLMHLLNSQLLGTKSWAVIAHFDHGIHEKSKDYCDFVAKEAKKLNLEFVSRKGNLGSGASEAAAREARYKFLHEIKDSYNAKAILTAHHQDDQIETLIINILRGTGRKGLASLKSTEEIIRPLLDYSKDQILAYSKEHNLKWREDPTNKDEKYLRNYLRLNILTKIDDQTRRKILSLSQENKLKNIEIDSIIGSIIGQENSLNRELFNGLDHNVSKEVLAEFFRYHRLKFDTKLLERGVNFIKTAKPTKKFMVTDKRFLEVRGPKVMLNLL